MASGSAEVDTKIAIVGRKGRLAACCRAMIRSGETLGCWRRGLLTMGDDTRIRFTITYIFRGLKGPQKPMPSDVRPRKEVRKTAKKPELAKSVEAIIRAAWLQTLIQL